MPEVNVVVGQVSASASRGEAREHCLHMDRPVEKGGEGKGPMGGETFLMGLGGCFMSNFLGAAQAREIAVSGVKLDITGTVEGNPARFVAVRMAVSAENLDRDTLAKLAQLAERSCIVGNTIRGCLDLSIELT